MPPKSLKLQAVSGLSWSFVSQIVRQTVNFIITAVLARLLMPDDFGLLGMATVFSGLIALFGELGVSSALIQNQSATDRHYSTAFWINFGAGTGLMFLFIGLSWPTAAFYGRPELIPLMAVMSVNFMVTSLGIVQQTLLTKKMNFRTLMIRDIVAVTMSGTIALACALNGLGVWSLVFQLLSFSIFNVLMLWFFSGWRPLFLVDKGAVREIFGFSSHILGFNIVNYFSRNLDYILIGKFLGAEALGLYTLAYKLMLLPLQNISFVVSKVMYPLFSKIQNDFPRIRSAYLKTIKGISLLTFPMMAGLALIASELIPVVFGPKWAPVVPLIEVLWVCGLLQSITSVSGTIYPAVGRPDLQLKYSLYFTLPSVVIAIVWGMQYGIFGVALFYTIRTFLATCVAQTIVNRLIELRWREFLAVLWQSMVLAVAMGLVVYLAAETTKGFFQRPLEMLIFKIVVGAAVCFIGGVILNPFDFRRRLMKISLRTS